MIKQSKINSCVLLLLVLIITTASLTSARSLASNYADDIKKAVEITEMDPLGMIDSPDSVNELMWSEACESGDDDCIKRRIMEEAHLDYIYTQQHKP